MTYSSACLEQRQKEAEKTKKLLTFGIISSIAVHGALLYVITTRPNSITKEEQKPIELILVQGKTSRNHSPRTT